MFIKEALGSTPVEERGRTGCGQREKLSCGADPTPWALWRTCALEGCPEWG